MYNIQDCFDDLNWGNHTICIYLKDIHLIEHNINILLEEEGFRRISQPPLPRNFKPLFKELLSHPRKMGCLYVIGLCLGNLGWTIVKDSHNDFLCRRRKDTARPRLSILSEKIGCDAFIYSVLDPYLGVLLEANAYGQTFVSGYTDNSYGMDDRDVFYQEPVDKLASGLNFNLLNVSNKLKIISKKISQENRQKKEKELATLIKQYPNQIERAFSEYKKIHESAFVRDDENLKQLLCKSKSFWEEDKLLYSAFAKAEQLESNGVRLLFFQVGRFDLNPETEEIWSPITSRKDYGVEQDIPW